MVESIHIHEDDWGMRNLYPLAAAEEAGADLRASRAAAERNRDPSGFGWTDIHLIGAPSITYADRGLRLIDAARALEALMPRVRLFNATVGAAFGSADRDPLGSYETEAWCFAFDEYCFLKLEPRDDLVERIWFELGHQAAGRAALRAAFERLNALEPSYLVDYWRDVAGPVEPEFLDRYFAPDSAP
jgi:hypothetical protein